MRVSGFPFKVIEKFLVVFLLVLGFSSNAQGGYLYGVRPAEYKKIIPAPVPFHIIKGKIKSKEDNQWIENIVVSIKLVDGYGNVYYEERALSNFIGRYRFTVPKLCGNSTCIIEVSDINNFYSSTRKEYYLKREYLYDNRQVVIATKFLLNKNNDLYFKHPLDY